MYKGLGGPWCTNFPWGHDFFRGPKKMSCPMVAPSQIMELGIVGTSSFVKSWMRAMARDKGLHPDEWYTPGKFGRKKKSRSKRMVKDSALSLGPEIQNSMKWILWCDLGDEKIRLQMTLPWKWTLRKVSAKRHEIQSENGVQGVCTSKEQL